MLNQPGSVQSYNDFLVQYKAPGCSSRDQEIGAGVCSGRCDVFVVKLDRLARSVADLMAILQALERKRVAMRILNLGGNRFIGTSVLTASI
jgi:Resolvase, N terminal domain